MACHLRFSRVSPARLRRRGGFKFWILYSFLLSKIITFKVFMLTFHIFLKRAIIKLSTACLGRYRSPPLMPLLKGSKKKLRTAILRDTSRFNKLVQFQLVLTCSAVKIVATILNKANKSTCPANRLRRRAFLAYTCWTTTIIKWPPAVAREAGGHCSSEYVEAKTPQNFQAAGSASTVPQVGVCELVGAHLDEGTLSFGTVSKSLPTHANFPRELLGPHNCGSQRGCDISSE